ncbi:OsmC family protein [Variovorax paradoxus]|nr:OsmC family protein [Variovorax paradoxus]
MAAEDIAAALERAETVLRRRPEAGLHEDSQAVARWTGGLGMVASHANGTEVLTDMPGEFGGSGERITPGWLLRAGFASCVATCIAMSAARQRIELEALEVRVDSRSDARGLLDLAEADGRPVNAGPLDMQLLVRISAPGVASERLRTLVEESHRCSPMSSAVQLAVPVSLCIEVGEG